MSPFDFTIRQLRPEIDAEQFREIRLEGLRNSPEAFGSDFAMENEKPLEWFADGLAGSDVFAALRAGVVAGVAGIAGQQGAKLAHEAVLWGMYVRPSARRQGVGRALVAAAVEHARTRAELIQLAVVHTNQTARRLYASLGFQEYGLEKDALKVGDQYYDEFLMALDLRGH